MREGVWEAVAELPAWVWACVPRGPVRGKVRGGGGGEVQVREARGEGGVLEGAADEGIQREDARAGRAGV